MARATSDPVVVSRADCHVAIGSVHPFLHLYPPYSILSFRCVYSGLPPIVVRFSLMRIVCFLRGA